MPPKFVQICSAGTQGSVGTTRSFAVGANVTVGNVLVVGMRTSAGFAISAVSDSSSTSNLWAWESTSNVTGTRGHLAHCYLTQPLTATDTITITMSGNGSSWYEIIEYAGVAPAKDVSNIGNNTGTTFTSATVATSATNFAPELAVTLVNTGVNTAGPPSHVFTPPTGFTLRDSSAFLTGSDYSLVMADKFPTTTGVQTANWSWTNASSYAIVISTFKAKGKGSFFPMF